MTYRAISNNIVTNTVNILICPDKFKGTLSAAAVCDAIAAGIRAAVPTSDLRSVPLADGGEGTCALLTELHRGERIKVTVTGPLFTPVSAGYGISRDGKIAFIEMAEASGLMLLEPSQRNPLVTTTYGTGELIADAIQRSVRTIVLGLGGSATNDAGIGMAAALGYSFQDALGEPLKPTGENLIHIRRISRATVNPGLRSVNVIALCDVTNPLYGAQGAAYVFAPQKGAGRAEVELLDAGLRNFRRMVHKHLALSVDFPGAGAAGGLGAGARAFLAATIQSGVRFIIETLALHEEIRKADLIITGEGQVDTQSFSGKVVGEVLHLARAERKPVVVVCGRSNIDPREARIRGIEAVVPLMDGNTSQRAAMEQASVHISERVAAYLRERVTQ